jgi:hypothetical protein
MSERSSEDLDVKASARHRQGDSQWDGHHQRKKKDMAYDEIEHDAQG